MEKSNHVMENESIVGLFGQVEQLVVVGMMRIQVVGSHIHLVHRRLRFARLGIARIAHC